MQSTVERRLDAQLARIANQISRIRQFDLNEADACQAALDESLEILRALTMYRGMLKNVAEEHFAASTLAFHRALG